MSSAPLKKSTVQVTYAQKRHLANMLSLGLLPDEHLGKIIEMIRTSIPALAEAEEIELDIESMDADLVSRLYLYVTNVVGMVDNGVGLAASSN